MLTPLPGRTLGAPPVPTSLDLLWCVAAEQRGLLTQTQCRSAGMTDKAVRWRLRRGTWVEVHRGVYSTTPGRDDWATLALAAQLAVDGSAWTGLTAATVHGLVRGEPRPFEVVVDRDRRVASPDGVHVVRRAHADRAVDALHWPWRTTVAETVLDVSARPGRTPDDLLGMLGRAFQLRRCSEDEVRAALALRRAYRWRPLLDDVLGDLAGGAESAMEVRYVRDVERPHGLPQGWRQRPSELVADRRHGVGYDRQRVLVELDGRLGHDDRGDRMRDGRRDRLGATSGWLTVRAFWPDVAVTPCRLAVEVGAVLGTRGWTDRVRPCRRRVCDVRLPRS